MAVFLGFLTISLLTYSQSSLILWIHFKRKAAMENIHHLKVRVGANEFEASGPPDVVQAQFAAWKELITTAPAITPPPAGEKPPAPGMQPPPPPPGVDMSYLDSLLDKITKTEDRIISLTVRPKSVDDAILLVLYGQKALRANDSVTGSEVLDGLIATGGLSVTRVDRLLEKAGVDGNVIVTGERRSKRYRLTNSGLQKARAIASECIAIVA
jgi:hypothetical protein